MRSDHRDEIEQRESELSLKIKEQLDLKTQLQREFHEKLEDEKLFQTQNLQNQFDIQLQLALETQRYEILTAKEYVIHSQQKQIKDL